MRARWLLSYASCIRPGLIETGRAGALFMGRRDVVERGLFFRGLWVVMVVGALILGSSLGAAAQSLDRAELKEWQSKDSSTTCDEIGWDAGKIVSGSPTEKELIHHGACVGAVLYLAVCGTIEGDGMFFEPSSGENWIACMVIAGNTGTSDASVSLFDFSLVDASGRKHSQDFTAQASLSTDAMFPTETLRQDQSVSGVIAFAVPTSASLPYVLEIDPMLNFSLTRSDPGAVVITELPSLERVLGGM